MKCHKKYTHTNKQTNKGNVTHPKEYNNFSITSPKETEILKIA
jgi:hypothetical protein